MILSFEGRTMSEIEDEVRAFLHGEPAAAAVQPGPAEPEQPAPEPPAAPKAESRYTVADVRQTLSNLARSGVPRDEIREAMKRICGADRVSEIPTERYEAIMNWSADRKGEQNHV